MSQRPSIVKGLLNGLLYPGWLKDFFIDPHGDQGDGQVVGNPGLNTHGLLGVWMIESDFTGVQGQPPQVEVLPKSPVVLPDPVVDVSDERMPDVPEVTANLVKPPGFWPGLDQGKALECGHPLKLCDRIDPFPFRCLGDRAVDGARFRCDASNEGDVALLDPSLLEVFLQRSSRILMQGEEHHTAGGAVQAVDGIHVLGEPISDHGHGDDSVPIPTAMDQHTGWFLNDGDVVVRVQEFHVRRQLFQAAFGSVSCGLRHGGSVGGSSISCKPRLPALFACRDPMKSCEIERLW